MSNKVIVNGKQEEITFVSKQENWDSHWELNGTSFDGHHTLWRFEYTPKTYLKESYLSGDEWRKGGAVKIYRNDVCVLNQFCREPDRAVFIIADKLPKLMDFMNWEEVKVGHKLYYMETPSYIKHICDDGEIVVAIEDETKEYPLWGYEQEDIANGEESLERDWDKTSRVHVLDERIYWWRNSLSIKQSKGK
jgi:hypothetical protein